MRFVSRYVTIEVGSSLFEDLTYVLLYLMLLLFGIVVIYGLFKRSAPQVDPPPPATATPTVTMIETEQVRGDPHRETRADPPARPAPGATMIPDDPPHYPPEWEASWREGGTAERIARMEGDANRFAYNRKIRHCKIECSRKRDPPRLFLRCTRCVESWQYRRALHMDMHLGTYHHDQHCPNIDNALNVSELRECARCYVDGQAYAAERRRLRRIAAM